MIDNIIQEAFENQEGRLFYILVPEEIVGDGAEELFKIGEAKGMDQSALARRLGAINNGIRPVLFNERGWSRGKWKPVKAWAFERFGVAKELEYLVRTALTRVEHQPIGQDYFLGEVEQAVDVANRVISLLGHSADDHEIDLHTTGDRQSPERSSANQNDPWGYRIGSGAYLINLVLVDSDFPLRIGDIESRTKVLAEELGLRSRDAVRQHLDSLKQRGHATQVNGNEWVATDLARLLWESEE